MKKSKTRPFLKNSTNSLISGFGRRPFLKASAGSTLASVCGMTLNKAAFAQDTSNPFNSCPVTAGVDLKGGAGALGVHDNDVCKQVNYITVEFEEIIVRPPFTAAHDGPSGRIFSGTMTVYVDVCYCHSAGLCSHDLEAVSEEVKDYTAYSGGYLSPVGSTVLAPGDDTSAPAGSYTVENWFGNPFGNIAGFPMNASFTTRRTALEIHPDGSTEGSSGCVVLPNAAEWTELKELMAYNRAADISPEPCSHGFGGSVPMIVSYTNGLTPVGNDRP